MNMLSEPKSIRLLSRSEQEVLDALRTLPEGIDLDDRPEMMTIGREQFRFPYQPSFVVSDQEGRKLIVEVQPPEGISWSNMATFVMATRTARKAGAGFVVLVTGQEGRHPRPRPEDFDEIPFSYVSDQASTVRAVLNALREAPIMNDARPGSAS